MPEHRRPHVLIISSDQQRYDAAGCYGNEHVRTPVLDELAEHGVLFENAYAQSPMCAPSRASLMTGMYPQNHGLWANGVQLSDTHRLLSRALADAGYDCGLVGKFHLGAAADGRTEERLDDGFRVFEWAHDPTHTSPQNRYQQWLAEKHPDVYAEYRSTVGDRPWDSEAGNKARGALFLDTITPEAHYSTWVAEKAVEFIEDPSRPDDQPMFLVANFFDPHHPFGAPAEYRDLYDPAALPTPVGSVQELASKPSPQLSYSRTSYAGTAPGFQDYSPEEIQGLVADYYAMVTQVDDQTGRILAALRERGIAEDTLVVFTSDHGEMLGDHAMVLKGPMMYDCAVKVPLIARWPSRLPAGRRVAGPVQTVDVTSTVLAATGTTASLPRAQGQDLMKVVEGSDGAGRDWALVVYRDSNFPQDPPLHTTALRVGDHKVVVWHGRPVLTGTPEGELYDLAADPDELTNLWDDAGHADLRRELTERLLETLVAVEDRGSPRVAAW